MIRYRLLQLLMTLFVLAALALLYTALTSPPRRCRCQSITFYHRQF